MDWETILNERNKIQSFRRGNSDNIFDNHRKLVHFNNYIEKYRKPFSIVSEEPEEFIIYIELPGIRKDDVKLKVVGRNIEVRANRKKEDYLDFEKEKRYFKRFDGFYQNIELPKVADTKIIEKIFRNGLLKLKIPKEKISKKLNIKSRNINR